MPDTIFALASGAGRAGIAVFRLSGSRCADIFRQLTGHELPSPRRATRIHLSDDRGDPLDDGLALWFPAPHSFTGEDVLEFHLHGGRAVANGLVETLLSLHLRPAEPGEFSRRAFQAGKLDLTQAEAIADLVDAETSSQRRQALRQLDGGLGQLAERWRQDLLAAQAHLEADIDFSDEEIPEEATHMARSALQTLIERMKIALAEGFRGERLRDGLSVVILGAPNVGKSSLLNRLAGRDAAIVSVSAGTTRDVIEVHLDLGGYPVVVADTAGLRDAVGDVEEEGIRRARARAATADIRLVVFHAETLPNLDAESMRLIDDSSFVVMNQCDRIHNPLPEKIAGFVPLAISAKTGMGMDVLIEQLTQRAAVALESSGSPVITRARHRHAIEQAISSLQRALTAPLPELMAEDVRSAVQAIGRMTGRVDVEDMLDVIFREFCIGK